ncbi:hypothetical protein SESBI_24543 [Sesbania bispinosa]|nr:hypothetical protein SESBI_24543 [Sesbania bispinosa]
METQRGYGTRKKIVRYGRFSNIKEGFSNSELEEFTAIVGCLILCGDEFVLERNNIGWMGRGEVVVVGGERVAAREEE